MLVSCGDDPLSENIVATWDLVSVQAESCSDEEFTVPFTEVADNNCITVQGDTACDFFIVFNAGGSGTLTFTTDGDTDSEDFTYTVDDDSNSGLICDPPDECDTFTVDGNSLSLVILDDCITTFIFERS